MHCITREAGAFPPRRRPQAAATWKLGAPPGWQFAPASLPAAGAAQQWTGLRPAHALPLSLTLLLLLLPRLPCLLLVVPPLPLLPLAAGLAGRWRVRRPLSLLPGLQAASACGCLGSTPGRSPPAPPACRAPAGDSDELMSGSSNGPCESSNAGASGNMQAMRSKQRWEVVGQHARASRTLSTECTLKPH